VADIEDLGTPPVFAEIVRVGYAVARLQLPTDPSVPRDVAAAATRVDDAVMGLQSAVDLAVELRDEGVRQPVSLVPQPQAKLDEERALVWSRHAALHANLVEFVDTSASLPPPQGRPAPYEAVMMQAVRALGAINEQRVLAQGSPGPRLPEPSDPAPSPTDVLRTATTEAEPSQDPQEVGRPGDGDRPPAATAALAWAPRPSAGQSPGSAAPAPTLVELERRISAISLDTVKTDQQLPLGGPPLARARGKLRQL
jgi:hypothetical protein